MPTGKGLKKNMHRNYTDRAASREKKLYLSRLVLVLICSKTSPGREGLKQTTGWVRLLGANEIFAKIVSSITLMQYQIIIIKISVHEVTCEQPSSSDT